MNVLLLGSTGFLGRETARAFAGPGLVCVSRTGAGGSRAVDIRHPDALARVADDTQPDLVLLLAAYREPDFCEADPAEARRLNVEPARALRRILPESVRLIFISTDYVFDGERPPYTEESPRTPVSEYGRTKCEAEDALAGRPNTAILRVPLLIGGGPTLAECGFIGQMVEAIRAGRPQLLDDVLIRFPTWTRDVAGAIRFLADHPLEGVFHYSGTRGGTRYAWTVETAKLLGLPHDHFTPSREIIQRKARRPLNSQLNDDKLRALGYGVHTDFAEVVRTVLGEL